MDKDNSLDDKISNFKQNTYKGDIMNIVILGATGGIGKVLSNNLSSNHDLYLGSRNKNNLDELILDITQESVYKENQNVLWRYVYEHSFFLIFSYEPFWKKGSFFSEKPTLIRPEQHILCSFYRSTPTFFHNNLCFLSFSQ